MSTFTRRATPPYSANPFQAFATYDQARRATKGAGVVALLAAALGGWALLRFLFGGTAVKFDRITILMLVPGTLLTVTMALLGWRIWVRPGPWKTFAILAFVAHDIFRVIRGLSSFSLLSVTALAVLGLALGVALISFRGALAMKRLQPVAQMQADLEVF